MSCCSPCVTPCNAGFFGNFANWLHNAIYGTLSCCQKQQIVANESTALVNASNGNNGEYGCNLSYSCAQSSAQSDVTNSLTLDNADPSQSSLLGSAGFKNFTKYALPLLIVALVLVFVYGYAKSR